MTGNTEMIAKGIRDGLTDAGVQCDMIKFRDAVPTALGKYDILGFGCPVMGYREAHVLREFIQKLRYVGGKYCFAFATHGTHGEYFPSSIYEVLTERQMKVLGIRRWYANSYIPGHSYPYPTAGHPDKIDVKEAYDWAQSLVELCKKNMAGEAELPPAPEKPEITLEEMLADLTRKEDERSGGTFGSNTPHVQVPNEYHPETCNYPKCHICMDNCPVHGIDLTMDPPVFGDPCTHCMLCAKLCPTRSIAPNFFYNTPGEKTINLVPEFYLEQLEKDEKAGMFRRKVPVSEIGWHNPYYKAGYDNKPWFILGKGPNGPKSKWWGAGMEEAEAAGENENK